MIQSQKSPADDTRVRGSTSLNPPNVPGPPWVLYTRVLFIPTATLSRSLWRKLRLRKLGNLPKSTSQERNPRFEPPLA